MPADKRNALTLAELDNNKHRMSSFYDANSYRQIAVLIFCLIELSKAAFIDRSTPLNHLTKLRRRDNRRLGLVMSDEFSLDNREFGVGEDSMFEALDRPDNSNDGNAYCKCQQVVLCHELAQYSASLQITLVKSMLPQ